MPPPRAIKPPARGKKKAKKQHLKLADKAGRKPPNTRKQRERNSQGQGAAWTPLTQPGGTPRALEQGVSASSGDSHSPTAQPRSWQGGRAACPSLPCRAERAGRAGLGSWTAGLVHGLWAVHTNGARSERLELCLPRRGSLTSLFLSEKCNHFLTWALGERRAALRPPCPCACGPGRSSTAARGRAPAPGCSRQLGGMWGTRPGCSREGHSQESRREGSPPSPPGSGSVAHPRPPMRFGGLGTPRCLCWLPPGNSRAWSPPGARRPSASPPTAGEIRRTSQSLDPAALGSSCCWFLHPTEPGGTRSQAGCGHRACVPTHQTSSPLVLSPPASEQLIFIPFPPGCTHPFPL